MKIVNLNEENKRTYFVCLMENNAEMQEVAHYKESWYNYMKDKGLGVKLAVNDEGKYGGMIQYMPVEYSFAGGKALYLINCIFVLGSKKDGGKFRKKGMGKALIKAAEDDAREKGAKGMVAWGVTIPTFMKASWFRKQGYKKVYKKGIMVLLWKPFTPDAEPPIWEVQDKEHRFELQPGKVTVTAFRNGWCPGMNMVLERAIKASGEFGDKVVYSEISTINKDDMISHGSVDDLYIDHKKIRMGPPPSYKKIKRAIARKVRKL